MKKTLKEEIHAFNTLANRLFAQAFKLITPSKKIIRRDDGSPYLIRYHLFGCRWFKVRLHHILLSDPDCLHDHPWDFISIILKGGYREHYSYSQWCRKNCVEESKDTSSSSDKVYGNWFNAGSVLYRRAEYRHSLELKRISRPILGGYCHKIETQSCWTLVIMFRRKREWGFWTKLGFVPWFKYDSKQKCD